MSHGAQRSERSATRWFFSPGRAVVPAWCRCEISPTLVPDSLAFLIGARSLLLVEANFSGQLGRLLRAETGLEFPDRLLKYDGEPFYPREIVTKTLEVIGHAGH